MEFFYRLCCATVACDLSKSKDVHGAAGHVKQIDLCWEPGTFKNKDEIKIDELDVGTG
jgi:hypothetical protein